LVQDKPNTFGSFPESNHASSAIQFVNDCLSVKANDKSSQGSSFSVFGASSEAKRQLLKERTQQYPEHVKYYGGSSPIWPARTLKGEAHQLAWPQEVVKKTYHKLGPSSR
jgi:hypothetical protein